MIMINIYLLFSSRVDTPPPKEACKFSRPPTKTRWTRIPAEWHGDLGPARGVAPGSLHRSRSWRPPARPAKRISEARQASQLGERCRNFPDLGDMSYPAHIKGIVINISTWCKHVRTTLVCLALQHAIRRQSSFTLNQHTQHNLFKRPLCLPLRQKTRANKQNVAFLRSGTAIFAITRTNRDLSRKKNN